MPVLGGHLAQSHVAAMWHCQGNVAPPGLGSRPDWGWGGLEGTPSCKHVNVRENVCRINLQGKGEQERKKESEKL